MDIEDGVVDYHHPGRDQNLQRGASAAPPGTAHQLLGLHREASCPSALHVVLATRGILVQCNGRAHPGTSGHGSCTGHLKVNGCFLCSCFKLRSRERPRRPAVCLLSCLGCYSTDQKPVSATQATESHKCKHISSLIYDLRIQVRKLTAGRAHSQPQRWVLCASSPNELQFLALLLLNPILTPGCLYPTPGERRASNFSPP